MFTAPKERIIRVNDKVNDNEQKVLDLISEDPGYTISQLAEKLGTSRKTVAARTKALKEKGYIERVGSHRQGYWKIVK